MPPDTDRIIPIGIDGFLSSVFYDYGILFFGEGQLPSTATYPV